MFRGYFDGEKVHELRGDGLDVHLFLGRFAGVVLARELFLLGFTAQRAQHPEQRRDQLRAEQRLGFIPREERDDVQRPAPSHALEPRRGRHLHAEPDDVRDVPRERLGLRLDELVQHLVRQTRVGLLAGGDGVARRGDDVRHELLRDLDLPGLAGHVTDEREHRAERREANGEGRVTETGAE